MENKTSCIVCGKETFPEMLCSCPERQPDGSWKPIKVEPNNGLSFAQETVLTIRQDGKLIAIELQNGHIERYTTEEATRAKSLAIFGADKPQGL